jgi:hypothetical protein
VDRAAEGRRFREAASSKCVRIKKRDRAPIVIEASSLFFPITLFQVSLQTDLSFKVQNMALDSPSPSPDSNNEEVEGPLGWQRPLDDMSHNELTTVRSQ